MSLDEQMENINRRREQKERERKEEERVEHEQQEEMERIERNQRMQRQRQNRKAEKGPSGPSGSVDSGDRRPSLLDPTPKPSSGGKLNMDALRDIEPTRRSLLGPSTLTSAQHARALAAMEKARGYMPGSNEPKNSGDSEFVPDWGRSVATAPKGDKEKTSDPREKTKLPPQEVPMKNLGDVIEEVIEGISKLAKDKEFREAMEKGLKEFMGPGPQDMLAATPADRTPSCTVHPRVPTGTKGN
ncbi:MAG: hypothetical protein HN403_18245 [Rhodospirillales bacterium]|nr:hypothetical protein [Rhodospirillales bacterium]